MGKDYSDSDDGSRSVSPNMTAPTPGFSLEHHDPSRSGSPNSQRSGSGSRASRSRSRSGSGHRSGSGSKSRSRSRSGSKASQRSGSKTSQHSGSQHSRSGSPESRRSRSKSRRSKRSASGSHRSGSGASNRSGSGSRRSRTGSRSGSQRSRSGSKSAGSQHSRSGSPASRRSRSGSRRSQSRKRSASGSRSGSAQSNKSGSQSRKNTPSKSRSASPKAPEKRKRNVLSDSGSDGEVNKTEVIKKKSTLIDTDSEPENEEPKEGITADAIFGDDVSDISTDDEGGKGNEKEKADDEADTRRSKTPEKARSRSRSRSMSNDQDFERVYQHLSDEEKQQVEPEPIPETRIDVEIPRILTDLGRDLHFVKMPNFLSVETRPFDVDNYEDEIDEEDVMDEEGRQRLKLKVGNTIRWREEYNSDGSIKRESNARIVKWSDGSMSLHLGNEIFDVYKQPLTGDHNHLFIRQGTGLQGQAVFRSKLTFRPHSTESFTHKKMTISLADRSQKTSGIKILTQVGHDPDANRYQKLKSEEEKLRQAMRAKQGNIAKQPKRSSNAANSSYHDEGSDDEGAISIAAIKGKYKKDKQKQSASAIYSSDGSDGSDIDSRRKKKIDRSKALRALEDEDGGSSDEGSGSGSESGSGNDDTKNNSAGSGDNDSD